MTWRCSACGRFVARHGRTFWLRFHWEGGELVCEQVGKNDPGAALYHRYHAKPSLPCGPVREVQQ